jgi:hypothetical protein
MNMLLKMKNNRRKKMKNSTIRLSVGGSSLHTIDLNHFMVVFLTKKIKWSKFTKLKRSLVDNLHCITSTMTHHLSQRGPTFFEKI